MFSARTLALASLAIAAQVASAAQCARSYTVQAGDYCDKISAANNVSTYQLAANNPGVINQDCSNLAIGSTLCLATEGEDCSQTYAVVAGDTCSQIWQNNGINATIFSFNNPQVNAACSNIYVGEVLCIANEVLVPPAPGVPIHTIAPIVPLNPPQATTTAPAAPIATVPTVAGTPVPATTPVPFPIAATTTTTMSLLTGRPVATTAPAFVVVTTPTASAPAPTSSAASTDEEDCEEYEVVDGSTDENLPFCDEL